MKKILLFFSLGAVAGLHAEPDPFAPSESPWRNAVFEAKPYTLEVAYAEIEVKEPVESIMSDPSEEFLNIAHKLRVAVSADDRGTISTDDWPELTYHLDEDFAINLFLRTEAGGMRETNTRVGLTEDEWVVLGGLRRDDTEAGLLEYRVAVRLTSPGQPGEGGGKIE